jgi:hypothetical protein
VEHHRLGIERILNDLSDEAEAWACSSIRYAGGVRLSKQASRLAKHAACLPNGPGVSLEAELKAGGVPETGRPAAA